MPDRDPTTFTSSIYCEICVEVLLPPVLITPDTCWITNEGGNVKPDPGVSSTTHPGSLFASGQTGSRVQTKITHVRVVCTTVNLLTFNHCFYQSHWFNTFFYIFFWRARVCWPCHCLCRTFCIFERCLDSNPESCHSKQACYHQLSHLRPYLATHLH
jgi:hypothetical protein